MENHGILKYLPESYKNQVKTQTYNYVSFNTGYCYYKRTVNNFMFGKVIEHRWAYYKGFKHILIGNLSDEEIAKWIISGKKIPKKNPYDLIPNRRYKLSEVSSIYHKDGDTIVGVNFQVATGHGFSIWLVAGYINDTHPFWKLRIQKVTGECEFIDFKECPTDNNIEYYKLREEIL